MSVGAVAVGGRGREVLGGEGGSINEAMVGRSSMLMRRAKSGDKDKDEQEI